MPYREISRFIRGAGAALFILMLTVMIGPQAIAQSPTTVSFSGTIQADQIDSLGLFGPAGANLGGQQFLLAVSYDSSDFVYSCGDFGCSYTAFTAGAMTATLTINGQTQSITTDQYNLAIINLSSDYVIFNNSTNYTGVYNINFSYEPSGSPSLTDPTVIATGGSALLCFASNAGAGGTECLGGVGGGVTIVSPFLLAADSDVRNIDLSSLLQGLPSFAAVTANGLAADSTSAAIVLYPVNTNNADVTLTTNNGTTLLPYEPYFMKRAPEIGDSTLVVRAKDLITIGSLYYAAALLQAPSAGVTPAYTTPITVTAQQQGAMQQQVSLPLVPPPIMLVHGIWGDDTSLSAYQTALSGEAPWSSDPGLIDAISYPAASAFNSSVSLNEMKRDTASLVAAMQNAGIVGTRVDVVAHSMGGLLVRSYSGTTRYRSFENRQQGQFHTIVTLDTPEAGSELASYLLMNKSKSISPAARKMPSIVAIWGGFCHSFGEKIEIQQCFSREGKSITEGAVASLEPNSVPLTTAPSPEITDTAWYAITATNTSGVENTVLNTLIEAINPSPSSAPTLTDILQGPNDDIVALSSQLAITPGNFYTFSGLAHTSLFGIDPSVTNAPAAIALTACWLADPTSPACTEMAGAQMVAYNNNGSSHFTQGRLKIESHPATGTIGVPLRLSVQATGLRAFAIQQVASHDQHSQQTISLPSDLWDGRTLTVVPNVLGETDVTIIASFEDGGVDLQTFHISTNIDPTNIISLRADHNFRTIIISDHIDHTAAPLYPEVVVQGLEKPMKVGAFSSFRVISPSTDPAISLDKNGWMSAVHSGTAVVEIEFEGHKDQLKVVVK